MGSAVGKGMESESHEEWLREMEMFTLEKRRDLYNSFKGDCSKVGVVLFSQAATGGETMASCCTRGGLGWT